MYNIEEATLDDEVLYVKVHPILDFRQHFKLQQTI